MAISTTLAVNVSATLTYGSLSLATASKTSSAVCLDTAGAKFEDLPVLSATALRSYYAALTIGTITKAKKFWLYVENYDTTADYVVLLSDFALTLDVLGVAYNAAAVEYLVNDVVYHAATTAWYRSIQVNGTGSAVKTPGSDTLFWAPIPTVTVPFGRAIVLVVTGGFHLVSATAPTLGQCKVVCIQDQAP